MQLNLMKMSNVFSLRQRPQQYTKIISTKKKQQTVQPTILNNQKEIRELTNVAPSVKAPKPSGNFEP